MFGEVVLHRELRLLQCGLFFLFWFWLFLGCGDGLLSRFGQFLLCFLHLGPDI